METQHSIKEHTGKNHIMPYMNLGDTELEISDELGRILEALFRYSRDSISIADSTGKLVVCSMAAAKLAGCRLDDYVGKNVKTVVRKQIMDKSVTLKVLSTKREASEVLYLGRTKKYVLVTGTPVFDEDGNITMVVLNERDITELKQAWGDWEKTYQLDEWSEEELGDEINMSVLRKHKIIARSEKMQQTLQDALKLARLSVSGILILGETGTGKGLLAKLIHKQSPRSSKPFVHINCTAIPQTLLESELFGYERGAFTGARREGKPGLFELAHGGTLFLDEIGDLPPPIQAKLLKFLDDQEITRVGGTQPKKLDCAVIAATNCDLEEKRNNQQFRDDLYYRLNTFPIKIPPLRERPEDVYAYIDYFLKKKNHHNQENKIMTPEAVDFLLQYPFPGNMRELKSLLEKAFTFTDTCEVNKGAFQIKMKPLEDEEGLNLKEEKQRLEREMLIRAKQRYKSTRNVAKHLGLHHSSVVRKLNKYGLA